MITEKILFVDDDPNILDSFRRILRSKFRVTTANSPFEGLQKLNKSGPYAVVVADMKMPKMNGIEFLNRVRKLFPDTVRIMLTGHGDMEVSVNAINNGEIFRFLTKPCGQSDLLKALDAGVNHYRLLTGEKELLEKTLTGTVQILMELLSLTNEEAMGKVTRIKRYVRDVAVHLGETDVWMYENAAMLSQIGCITLPPSVLEKVSTGQKLEKNELQMYSQHPRIAADIVRKIPRMEHIADIITYQAKCFDGKGVPVDPLKGEDIPLGARILKLILDFDLYVIRGLGKKEALFKMSKYRERYDPRVFRAFVSVLQMEEDYQIRKVKVEEILPYMILLQDIICLTGTVLLKKGNEISEGIAEKLQRMDELYGVKQPIEVLIPPRCLSSAE